MKAFFWKDKNVQVEGVVFHENAGKARHALVSAAQDVGYQTTYKDIEINRAKQLDGSKTKLGEPKPGLGYSIDFISFEEG